MGLFTGQSVSLKLCPAEVSSGIIFQRVDLPQRPLLPAKAENVQATPRCTILGKDGVSVQTVEHLLAALYACGIDNVLIEISGAEVPIFDGSSSSFIEAIEEVGLEAQTSTKPIIALSSPLYWSQGDVHIVALPCQEYRISYTLHYPHAKILRSQFYSISVSQETFKSEIASCRTFSLYEEVVPLIEKGLIKGSLENGVIIKDDQVLNPEGLRFPDEMARHKILDMIGDLSLIGIPFTAHIIAIRSGHASNNAFAKQLFNHIQMEIS
jgi:UDP-3-O-[3-hydroxymyristoyl] N-acetylglucosamine deacetylase